MIGRNTSSTVPGTRVERNTTTCGADLALIALPISTASRKMAPWSWLPFAADGVPTQINDMSLSRTALPASVVTDTLPLDGHLVHQGDHALFHHRRLAGHDQVELGLVNIDTNHVVPVT